MIGYVLVSLCEAVNEKDLLDKVSDMEEVTEANLLFGEWDLFVKAEINSPELLSAFVLDSIRSLPEVKMTSTLIVAK